MSRKLIVYPIILLNLFLFILTVGWLPEFLKNPGIVEVSLSYNPTTLVVLAVVISIVCILVGIKAIISSEIKTKEDIFP
ncbi:hypothetical protein KA005_84080 [bacterium]|nr:hypothetical protein [bacterium]